MAEQTGRPLVWIDEASTKPTPTDKALSAIFAFKPLPENLYLTAEERLVCRHLQDFLEAANQNPSMVPLGAMQRSFEQMVEVCEQTSPQWHDLPATLEGLWYCCHGLYDLAVDTVEKTTLLARSATSSYEFLPYLALLYYGLALNSAKGPRVGEAFVDAQPFKIQHAHNATKRIAHTDQMILAADDSTPTFRLARSIEGLMTHNEDHYLQGIGGLEPLIEAYVAPVLSFVRDGVLEAKPADTLYGRFGQLMAARLVGRGEAREVPEAALPTGIALSRLVSGCRERQATVAAWAHDYWASISAFKPERDDGIYTPRFREVARQLLPASCADRRTAHALKCAYLAFIVTHEALQRSEYAISAYVAVFRRNISEATPATTTNVALTAHLSDAMGDELSALANALASTGTAIARQQVARSLEAALAQTSSSESMRNSRLSVQERQDLRAVQTAALNLVSTQAPSALADRAIVALDLVSQKTDL